MAVTFSLSMCVPANTTDTMNIEKLDLSSIEQVEFPRNQYVRSATEKTQIVLHHTVSGDSVDGDIHTWKKTKERVATPVIVERSGNIVQLFSSRYWAYHLGLKVDNFKSMGLSYLNLNKNSLGIEIDSWGGLKFIDGEWRASVNKFGTGSLVNKHGQKYKVVLPSDRVQLYSNGFRGYEAFEKYTDKQLYSVAQLLKYWGDRYSIPLNYNENIFEVNKQAMSGTPGVWSHVSYRKDKSDCHPQPELISMLNSLT